MRVVAGAAGCFVWMCIVSVNRLRCSALCFTALIACGSFRENRDAKSLWQLLEERCAGSACNCDIKFQNEH